MKFNDFLNRLYENSNQSDKGQYVLEIFSALCGESNPFKANKGYPYCSALPEGLRGKDSGYRKRLYKETDTGISNPIKNHIRGNENKETFIAYLEKSVQPEMFSKLCNALEVPESVERLILFESIFKQFLKFVYSQEIEVDDIVAVTVKELSTDKEEVTTSDYKGAEPQNETHDDSKKFQDNSSHKEMVRIFKETAEYCHIVDLISSDPSLIDLRKLLSHCDLLLLATRFVDDIQSELITPFNTYKGDLLYIKISQFATLVTKYKEYLKRELPHYGFPRSLLVDIPSLPEIKPDRQLPNSKSEFEIETERYCTKLKSLYDEIYNADAK